MALFPKMFDLLKNQLLAFSTLKFDCASAVYGWDNQPCRVVF